MLKFPKLTGLICALIWINLLSLNAQDNTCITFEELPAGAVYGKDGGHQPGDLAFSSQGVNVYLEEFLYSNSSETGFWNATVESDIFGEQPALDGQALFISNINLKFDFTSLDKPVNGLCFEIVDGGGEENISVNGHAITILPDFLNVETEIAAGVTISVIPVPNTNDDYPKNLEICLRGKIESLIIGGQEFGFDNLCLYHAACPLPEIKAEIVNCLSVGPLATIYELEITASVETDLNILPFDVFVNGELLGLFKLSDLPLRMKQIQLLNTIDLFKVEVCVKGWDCCAEIELTNSGCPEGCSLDKVSVGEIACSFDGYYYAKLYTKGSNLSGKVTITNEAGETWTGPADGSELVKFPIPSQHYDKWVVCDPANPDCCFTFDFEVPCSPCRIGALQVEATECSDDGMFYFKLDFEHFTPTGQFHVFINDAPYAAYAYSNLPLRLGPFKGDGQTGWKILVRDASEQCAQDVYLEPVSCAPLNCRIGPLQLSDRECLNSEQFYFKLDFEHENTSEKFQLLLNGEVYESYTYADLPIRVGPLPADGTTDWHVLVRDSKGECAEDTKFEAVTCQPKECEIGPLQLSGPVCTPNGVFFVKLDFKYKNTSERFQVVLNGEVFGTYAYADLPIRIGPLPADGTTDWHLLVRDQYGHCASDTKIPAVDCQPQQCKLDDLRISGPLCLPGSNQFYFKLNFDHWNTADKFILLINEEKYETYSYADLPIRVGPFSSEDTQIQWKIRVLDASENCESVGVLSGLLCNPTQCEIGDLDISGPVCLDDGQFYFKLNFKYQNTSDRFRVLLNNEVFESYAYNDLPVRVGPLPADGLTDWQIVVEDISKNCGQETKLPAVTCYPEECKIGHLNISDPICTDAAGQFYFELDFDHKNTSDAFKLYLNGELYEQYPYSKLPVKVGPLPADGLTDWHVLVQDLGGFCAEDAKLEAVNCNPKNCAIGALKVSEPICTDDGQFYFELNFAHENTSDKFQLLLDHEVYESYSYADLPIKVGPLPATANKEWHVLVRDLSTSNTNPCASDVVYGPVNCGGGDCKIGALKLFDEHCSEDGTEFYVWLNFEHANTSDIFQLFLNDQEVGTYAYGALPIKIGPLNAQTDVDWKLLVRDKSGKCAEDIHFSAPNCEPTGGDCQLSGLNVERYACIGGQFLVDLSFDITHPGGSGYYVFTNGQISGPHSYSQPFITLGPYVGDGTTTYDFLVIDIDDPSCYGYYELGPVDCSNPCEIGFVTAEPHECDGDGNFLVDIAFNYDKVGSSGFKVLVNDQDMGTFSYGDEKYTIGPLKGDGQTSYRIAIIDNDNPDCQDFTIIDPIDCLPCQIGELDYSVQCLQNAEKFILHLDFDYQDPDSYQFVLAIGDEVIGKFPYTDLPLSREMTLPANGELIVQVWDSENEDCAQKAQLTIPCCYLSEPVVETHPCQNNGELWFDLDLNYHNVSDSFQLVFGIWGGDLRYRNYAYSDLPLTLGPLTGQAAEKWYFEATDLGFYCQSSTYFETDYCDNDACAEWDQTPLGAYGPLTGYAPGAEIDQEDGLHLSFAASNPANCNCSVFLVKATTFPLFAAATGQVVLLDNSAAMISAPGYTINSLTVDYYFPGNEVVIKVNDEAMAGASLPTKLPTDIAPGVKLKVEAASNDGRRGTMTFSGNISRLTFLSRGRLALDNFCTELTEKDDKVWPGDTNLDNIANHIDLLNIGLGFGTKGPIRANANLNWEAQQAENWPELFFEDDLNFKHADANGDGVIDRADRGAILENYGLSHGPLPVFTEVPVTDNDPPLYVDFEAATAPITTGGTFQVPIIFGTQARPVQDIYGIAFTITFDPAVIDPASIEVVYPDSWLGDTQENLLTIDRTLEASGRIEVALTRINKVNAGGFGPIASLIGAIDDIAGKYTEVGITEVVAITANEDRVPVNGVATKVEFKDEFRPEVGYIDLGASLNIFPNPTSGEVLVTTRFNFPIEHIRVLDGYGNPTGLQVVGKNRIDLSSLPSGIYMLRIQLGKYTISRKIVKVN